MKKKITANSKWYHHTLKFKTPRKSWIRYWENCRYGKIVILNVIKRKQNKLIHFNPCLTRTHKNQESSFQEPLHFQVNRLSIQINIWVGYHPSFLLALSARLVLFSETPAFFHAHLLYTPCIINTKISFR